RVAAWRKRHGMTGRDDTPFAAITSSIDLCHAESTDINELIDTIRAQMPNTVLIVIDTVSRALAGGNENAPDDMGALVASLDRLRDALGCHVCAVHHVGKDASRGSRGHSLLHCGVDTEILVTREAGSGIATATITKQRDGIAGGQIAFRLLSVELGQDQDGDPVTSCIVEPAEGSAPAAHKRPPSGLTGTKESDLGFPAGVWRASQGGCAMASFSPYPPLTDSD
ncbi:MAG: AAA family ATPase, partial [Steroidobacteraceae bacterium]